MSEKMVCEDESTNQCLPWVQKYSVFLLCYTHCCSFACQEHIVLMDSHKTLVRGPVFTVLTVITNHVCQDGVW